jgi:hypothetical protein
MMSKCLNCNINIDGNNKTCPLCNYNVRNKSNSKVAYPKYETVKKNNNKIFTSIYLIILIIVILYLSINFIFDINQINILFTIILTLVIPIIIVSRNIFSDKIAIGYKILMIYATVSTLLMIIDGFTNFNKWSTTYVIPIMTVVIAMIFTIVAMFKKKLFKEYIGYLIIIFFISFCPIILFAFSLANSIWTSILTLAYCLVITIILLIFSFNKFKDEIKKRFNS